MVSLNHNWLPAKMLVSVIGKIIATSMLDWGWLSLKLLTYKLVMSMSLA